jgi:hypothetical protein
VTWWQPELPLELWKMGDLEMGDDARGAALARTRSAKRIHTVRVVDDLL